MARSKRDKQVVVNQAYFELIERKAEALDSMVTGDGSIAVCLEDIKKIGKISADWDKIDAQDLSGSKPYEASAGG